MGAGGSSNSRSPPAQDIERSPPENSKRLGSDQNAFSGHDNEGHLPDGPTSSCCDHRERNHAAYEAAARVTSTPRKSLSRQTSIDDEIEEIVANTVDLMKEKESKIADERWTSSARTVSPRSSNIQKRLCPNFVVGITERIPRTEEPVSPPPDYSSGEVNCTQDNNIQETAQDIDFAKFKKANHKGVSIQRHGKIVHHQDSDLLWRLGLVSPETYTLKPSSRSAPTVHGPYLKPPSYDLSEEQLMANIEKEFAECTSAV